VQLPGGLREPEGFAVIFPANKYPGEAGAVDPSCVCKGRLLCTASCLDCAWPVAADLVGGEVADVLCASRCGAIFDAKTGRFPKLQIGSTSSKAGNIPLVTFSVARPLNKTCKCSCL
jgi:hypothetical protein